jgi:hypothetical protein
MNRQDIRRRSLLLLSTPIWAIPFAPAHAAGSASVELPNIAPWTIANQPGKPGILPEYIAELSRRSGIELRANAMVYARVSYALAAGASDLAIGPAGPELDAVGQRLALVFPARVALLSRADRPSPAVQACPAVVGMVRGSTFPIQPPGENCRRTYEIKDLDQGVKMVAARRLDMVVGTDLAIRAAVARSGLPASSFAPPLETGQIDFILYARLDLPPEVAARLSAAAAEMLRQKWHEPLMTRYRD